MKRLLLLLLLLPSVAWAQIDVPSQTPPHKIIQAKLTAPIPEGAEIQGGWLAPTADLLPGCSATEALLTAAPGQHQLSFRGAWIKTEPVEVGDKTIQALIGFGFLDYSQTFTVGDMPDPGPKPQPNPLPPPDQRWALIVEETSQRTPAQGNLWVLLRKNYSMSKLLIVDKDSEAPSLQPVLQAVRETSLALPVLVVLSTKDDKVLRIESCPNTLQGVEEAIIK